MTANVQDRRWFFVTSERAETLGQTIRTCCVMKKFDLLAYCILPNHVHLLVRKLPADENLRSAPTAQRTLGSARCAEKTESFEAEPLPNANAFLFPRFLFPYRRLPSRRSLKKRPTLSDLMHSIKSTFSQHLHQGRFWQHRSNFRIVETEEYLSNVIEYIRYNYRKMDLSELYGQLPFMCIDESTIQRIFDDQKT